MKPKILIFNPYAASSPHNEVALEVALDFKNQGYDPHFITCHSELLTCDPNPKHDWKDCLRCSSLSKSSLNVIGIKSENQHPLSLNYQMDMASIPRFRHVRELKKYQLGGVPVGAGVAFSIIVSLTRDSEPDMERFRFFYEKAIPTYMALFYFITKKLEELRPEKFYIFHGHSLVYAAAKEAAKKVGIECLIGEREYYHEYILLKNHGGLDLNRIVEQIENAEARMWQDPKGREIGVSWFTKNRDGNKEQLFNYLRDQQIGQLPKGFNPNKRNIAIFGSSEDEIESSDEFRNPWFPYQSEGIRYIINNVKDPDIHFYLRVHPNLKNRESTQKRQLSSLSSPNLTVLDAYSSIDSYALMEHCEKTLTFGSTVAIEATFWGKPSILAGRAFHEKLGTSYIPTSPENLIELVKADLKPLSKEKAIVYGYWWKTRGQPFKYITPKNPKTSDRTSYNGKYIDLTIGVALVFKWLSIWYRSQPYMLRFWEWITWKGVREKWRPMPRAS